MAAVNTNIVNELNYSDISDYVEQAANGTIPISEKLDRPSGGEVFVCNNTENGKFQQTGITVAYSSNGSDVNKQLLAMCRLSCVYNIN